MKHRMVVAGFALAAVCGVVTPATARASVTGDWNLAFQSQTDGPPALAIRSRAPSSATAARPARR